VEPPFDEWATLARANADAAASWTFGVAGMGARDVRTLARSEALEAAVVFCARLGIPTRPVEGEPDLIVVTGHQPELYHPGVWAKDFLLQRLADETGAAAIDVVVDSDGFDSVGMRTPCMRPEPLSCSADLAVGGKDGCYGCAPVPTDDTMREFEIAGRDALATLPVAAPLHNFERFSSQMRSAGPSTRNLAEFVTLARRRYEASAGTDYLELPITVLAGSRAFARFVAHIALDARAFAEAYNAALAGYRERTGTRSAAQPFPDLAIRDDEVELPLWLVGADRRTVWVRTTDGAALVADGAVLCELGLDAPIAAERLVAAGLALAPKALALTMFVRMFVADLFIHGVGGGRYDQVTDDVIRRYFGTEPPSFAVASLTVVLPLGVPVVTDAEIEDAAMALNRLEHNPDQMLADARFGSAEDAARAEALVSEKRELVAAIARADADKKMVGARIREVNSALASLLAPVKRQLVERVARLERAREARNVLTDRTYPFCLWDPAQMRQTVDDIVDTRAAG
jgi:hypothetical protein